MSFVMPASAVESKGTRSHMAPELLYPRKSDPREGRVSEQADVYAFGMVVYEVLTGRPPWGGRRQPEVTLRVIEGKRPNKPETAGDIGFGGGTWELVQQCWEQNRNERPTAEKIVEHFHCVAGTSTDVPPGPTVPAREYEHITASESESGSGDAGYCQCLLSSHLPHAKPDLAQYLQPDYSSLLLSQA
jgi:serine/threonine protein kinase